VESFNIENSGYIIHKKLLPTTFSLLAGQMRLISPFALLYFYFYAFNNGGVNIVYDFFTGSDATQYFC